jgi:hypothetical protein
MAKAQRMARAGPSKEARNLSAVVLISFPRKRPRDRLAEELAIPDLREPAASVTLAGDSSAKVKTSLAAKAQALRTKSLANVEEAAQAASERMSLPRWER